MKTFKPEPNVPFWYDGAGVFIHVLTYVMPRRLRVPEPGEWGVIEQLWAMSQGLV